MRTLWRVLALAALLASAAVPSASDAAPAAGGPSPKTTFYFGLTRPESAARAAFFAVQRPGSSTYRRFTSPRRIAAVYGASPSVRRRFLRLVRGYGFTAKIDASGVFARVRGPVALFDRVFKVKVVEENGDEPPVHAFSVKGAPHLPAPLRPLVDDVVTSFAQQIPAGPRLAERGTRPRRRQAPCSETHRNLGTGLREGEGHRRVQLRPGAPGVWHRPGRLGRGRVGGATRAPGSAVQARHRR